MLGEEDSEFPFEGQGGEGCVLMGKRCQFIEKKSNMAWIKHV